MATALTGPGVPEAEALAQDVARRILGEDVTQVKRMVGKVLTGNGITTYANGAYSLIGAAELSDDERDELQQLCRQRLDAFRAQRGEEVFAHRSRNRTPISGSIKYRVFTRARGRCECCGAHEHQRALEVDHIIPKNHGGSDDISNLQALCFRCNAGKRDTDNTDFRGLQASYGHRQQGCVFCELEGCGRVVLQNELAICIADGMELHQPEWNAVTQLLKQRQEQLAAQDPTISAWNVGLNAGQTAGQTVMHAHWHLIPRRLGDCEQPRGGVGGVIPAKQTY